MFAKLGEGLLEEKGAVFPMWSNSAQTTTVSDVNLSKAANADGNKTQCNPLKSADLNPYIIEKPNSSIIRGPKFKKFAHYIAKCLF